MKVMHLRLVRTQDKAVEPGLGRLARLPIAWTCTVKARRLLFVVLCAPGFLTVFTTTWHRSLFWMAAGFVAFGAAVAFRRSSEPSFVAATAAGLWPPAFARASQESSNA